MFKTLKDVNVEGKKVLVRVDFNVPLKNRNVADDSRIKAVIPTIKHLLIDNVKQIILMSHMGRPKGKVDEELRLDPVARHLERLLEEKVTKLNDCVDIEIPEVDGENNRIVLLENLRFHSGETEDDEKFAEKLATHAELYVNDAFANCHRTHASVHAITKFLPSYAGFTVEHEIKTIMSVIEKPETPFIVIIGGAKLETKIPVIKYLFDKVDKMILGGAMIFAFYKALGLEIGNSLVNSKSVEYAKEILEKANPKLILPEDVVICADADGKGETQVVHYNAIPPNMMGLDIGPDTIHVFEEHLKLAKTVLWNGPMGRFEVPTFKEGTNHVAEVLGNISESGAKVIIGGGDSVAAINNLGIAKKMTHISTGGGASLALFSGEKLPAIEALEENAKQY